MAAKHKKTSQVSVVFHHEFVNVQFYSIKCKKRNHKYCVSIKPNLFNSGLLPSWLAGDSFFRVVSHQL